MDAAKPFFSNKITNSNDFISTKCSGISKGKLVENEEEPVALFNIVFVNTIEDIIVSAQTSLGECFKPQNDRESFKNIIYEYRSHPVILQRKEIYKQTEIFGFPKVNPADLNKFTNSSNLKKAAGSKEIPPKPLKTPANTIDAENTKLLSNNISNTLFPQETKTAYVTTIYKKDKKERGIWAVSRQIFPRRTLPRWTLTRRTVSRRHFPNG